MQQQPYQQPYGSSIKAIFKEDVKEIVPLLLPGVDILETLDIEVLQPPLRADRAYLIDYYRKSHVLQIEFQSNKDDNIVYRLLNYHSSLLQDYHLPVISIIVYLFRCTVAVSPFVERSGEEALLTFYFRVLELWKLDARQYVRNRMIGMYTLLPTMDHADATVLLQAIEELIEYYQEDENQLTQRLLWFKIFLERSDTVLPIDKEKVVERLDIFEQLLEESSIVRKQRALGEEIGFSKGETVGKEQGKVEAARQIFVYLVSTHFPLLTDLASLKIARATHLEKIQEAIGRITSAHDQTTALEILNSVENA